MAWVLLVLAIFSEVAATLALKASDGFSRLLPSVVVVAGYLASLGLLGLTLRSLPVGVTYAVWAGVGTFGAALGAVVLFGERMSWLLGVGIGLVVAGVVLVTLAEAQA
jgi:small multidrug resistance pump